MTTETESLRQKFERHIVATGRSEGELIFEAGHYLYPDVQEIWELYQAGHAAAKAETATAGAPMAMAMVQCHGSAEHPLYTADQLAAAVAAERERAARVCERIADDYNRREGLKYAELKTDAETGANDCADAIRAGAKEPTP